MNLVPPTGPLRLLALARLVNTVGSGLFSTSVALFSTRSVGPYLGGVTHLGLGIGSALAGVALAVGTRGAYVSLLLADALGDLALRPDHGRELVLGPEGDVGDGRRQRPAAFADDIVTPMLVIHGDRDYRVPVGEALSLRWAL